MIEWLTDCATKLKTWVQSEGPTWRKERTDSLKLSSEHPWADTCTHISKQTNKQMSWRWKYDSQAILKCWDKMAKLPEHLERWEKQEAESECLWRNTGSFFFSNSGCCCLTTHWPWKGWERLFSLDSSHLVSLSIWVCPFWSSGTVWWVSC